MRAGLGVAEALRGDISLANWSTCFELSVVHGRNSGFSVASFSLLRRLTRLVDGLHVDLGTNSRRFDGVVGPVLNDDADSMGDASGTSISLWSIRRDILALPSRLWHKDDSKFHLGFQGWLCFSVNVLSMLVGRLGCDTVAVFGFLVVATVTLTTCGAAQFFDMQLRASTYQTGQQHAMSRRERFIRGDGLLGKMRD